MFHQVHEILLQLIGAKLVGAGVEILADLSQTAGIQIDGFVALAPQGQFGEVALIQGLESGMVLSIHDVSPRRPSRHGRDSEDYRRFGPPLPRSGFVQPDHGAVSKIREPGLTWVG